MLIAILRKRSRKTCAVRNQMLQIRKSETRDLAFVACERGHHNLGLTGTLNSLKLEFGDMKPCVDRNLTQTQPKDVFCSKLDASDI